MSIEAMKQAVVALDDALGYGSQRLDDKLTNAITSLRQAIANEALDKKAENARELGLDYAPAQDFVCSTGLCHFKNARQREWVGLTRDQMEELFWPWSNNTEYKIPLFEFRQVYSIIEAKLKEKNT